jgi:hypothetical protein
MTEMEPERARIVFRTWLRALAGDPDAAVAASLAYEELSPEGRDAWLDAVEQDAQDVPPLAVYAPLLAVEQDEARRSRMLGRLCHAKLPSPTSVKAWHGVRGSERAAVVMAPVYLEFVEVVGARWEDDGFVEFLHVPLAHVRDPLPDLKAPLEPAPPMDVVEELALAVLAHDRSGKPRPQGAQALARYFVPCIF